MKFGGLQSRSRRGRAKKFSCSYQESNPAHTPDSSVWQTYTTLPPRDPIVQRAGRHMLIEWRNAHKQVKGETGERVREGNRQKERDKC